MLPFGHVSDPTALLAAATEGVETGERRGREVKGELLKSNSHSLSHFHRGHTQRERERTEAKKVSTRKMCCAEKHSFFF